MEYRASTVVLVEEHSRFARTPWPQEPLASGKIRDRRLRNEFLDELSALFSPQVLDPVIEKLDLTAVWRLPDSQSARAALAERIAVKEEPGTELFRVTVRADEPGQAVAVANEVTKAWEQLVVSVDAAHLNGEGESASKRRKEMEGKVARARSIVMEFIQPFLSIDPPYSRELPSYVIPEDQKQAYESARQEYMKAKEELAVLVEEQEKMRVFGVLRRRPFTIFEEADLSHVVAWPDARFWRNTLIAVSSLALLLLGCGAWGLRRPGHPRG